jgi:hypothetical protein
MMWGQDHLWNVGTPKSMNFHSCSVSDDEASPRVRMQLQISRIQNTARKRRRSAKKKPEDK